MSALSPRLPRVLAALALVVAPALTPRAAIADPTPADRTLAQSLFEQARRQMAAHDYAAACPKLAQSQSLDPSAGTLLNLAVCHEASGRLATAWVEFSDAAAAARAAHEDTRVSFATTRAQALEPRLAHLVVTLHGPADGVTATLDGAPVGSAVFTSPLPVDAGTHALVVAVDGKAVWQKAVEVRDGASVAVEVPADALVRASGAAPAGTGTPALAASLSGSGPGSGSRAPAFVVLGVGAAGLVVGSVFGVVALGQKSTLDGIAGCPSACPPSQHSKIDALHGSEIASDIGLGVGLAGAAIGTVLLLRGSGGEAPAPVAVDLAPTGVRVRGSF